MLAAPLPYATSPTTVDRYCKEVIETIPKKKPIPIRVSGLGMEAVQASP
jgi:hypothetical protein